MQYILPQLSALVILTGVSVAVIQYLFTNHKTHLKDFANSLKKIDFDGNNEYDSKLEKQWESAINNYKQHTYLINQNDSIISGLIIIVFLLFIYIIASLPAIGMTQELISTVFLNIFIFALAIALMMWLIMNLYILSQIFRKETSIKSELRDIEEQHQVVDKVLNKNR